MRYKCCKDSIFCHPQINNSTMMAIESFWKNYLSSFSKNCNLPFSIILKFLLLNLLFHKYITRAAISLYFELDRIYNLEGCNLQIAISLFKGVWFQ